MMNRKTILSVLIANAFAVSSAAASSELELYGSLAAAVENLDNGTTKTTEVSNNHSAVGVKGSTDLSNDIKGVFLFDAFIAIDSGAGNSNGGSLLGGGRDGYVGLAGKFGTVALGYHGRPWKTSTNNMDVFGSTIADYSALIGTTPGGSYFDGGIGNGVIWFLPNMGGVSGHVQYGADEADDGSNDSGIQLNYTNDDFYAVVSYDIDGQAVGDDVTALKVGAQYKFGATTLGAIYDSISDSPANTRDAFWLSAAHKAGDFTLKAAFAQANDSDAGSDGATYVAVGADYMIVENLTAYAIFSQISNESGGSYGFISSPHTSSNTNTAVATGEDSNVLALGVKVDFSMKK